MSEAEKTENYYKYVLGQILIDARSIDVTGNPNVDSNVDSIIKRVSMVLRGEWHESWVWWIWKSEI